MNSGKYVFSQITDFLPKRYFERLVMMISNDRTQGWNLTHWNQMLVLMFGQLDGSNSLRELTDITTAHAKKSFHLGFGKNPINSINKIHTQLDIVSQIPVSFYITEAAVHDVKGMDWINYEPFACYIFDRGYWDLERLYRIELLNSFFVIREKSRPKFQVVDGEDLLEGADNILRDQTVRFTTNGNRTNYPAVIRRIVYYEPELKRTFTYYTNNFFLKAKDIDFLYKKRWAVESFFKWMKGQLRIKSFWGNTENAVRIEDYIAIITYCTTAILAKKLNLNRSIYQVMRILGMSTNIL